MRPAQVQERALLRAKIPRGVRLTTCLKFDARQRPVAVDFGPATVTPVKFKSRLL
jgi:hypothetical protein